MIFSICITMNPMTYVSAQESNPTAELLQYGTADGTAINYYFGADGNPYTIVNGEQMLVALPLAQYLVTDEEILNELHS